MKHGDVIYAALVQIGVFVDVERIDFDADNAEVLAREFDCFADVFHRRHSAALAGQQQDFLQAGCGDSLKLLLDFIHVELGAADFVVAVEAAVDTVVFAIVGDVQRGEHLHRVAEMLARLHLCALRHLFKEGRGSRGEQRGEVLGLEHIAV